MFDKYIKDYKFYLERYSFGNTFIINIPSEQKDNLMKFEEYIRNLLPQYNGLYKLITFHIRYKYEDSDEEAY